MKYGSFTRIIRSLYEVKPLSELYLVTAPIPLKVFEYYSDYQESHPDRYSRPGPNGE